MVRAINEQSYILHLIRYVTVSIINSSIKAAATCTSPIQPFFFIFLFAPLKGLTKCQIEHHLAVLKSN